MSDKSVAVLPIAPRNPHASQKVRGAAARIAPADFGACLLRGRELTNRRLEEIADTTKISIQQLRALERGDLHYLPGGIYRRAIVRQYAQAVGLDVEETLRDLASVSTEVDDRFQRVDAIGHPRGDAGSSSLTTALRSSAAALVVLGAVAAVATVWYRAGTTAPAAAVSVTTASAPAPEADEPAIALVAATEPAVRANAGDIELATEPAVLQKEPETGNVAEADATEGELRIISEPAGALVTVNGIGWGPTPVTVRFMPFGKKLIRVTKPGYASTQRGLDFAPNRRVRSVRIQLSAESPDTR